jgi:hypothetical protein
MRPVPLVTLCGGLLLAGHLASAQGPAELPGFERSPHFGEWIREGTFDPSVRHHTNVPGDFNPALPTQVIFFALPNGNTTAQTIGRAMTEGLDWHFDIQHIGAQTRWLRDVVTDQNTVVVYLEADPRSWPAWRRQHENSSALIVDLLEELAADFGTDTTWVLTGHSGGGSLTFGFLNGVDRIPDQVKRIAFLDSNYAYSDEEAHGAKLIEWLRRSPENTLVVIAYDDREITFDGKKVVSDTGGTYRATTQRMLSRLHEDVELMDSRDGDFLLWSGMEGQIDIRVHTNPENRILHTVLVGDMNGLMHALTSGTPLEEQAGSLEMGRRYEAWIQEGD